MDKNKSKLISNAYPELAPLIQQRETNDLLKSLIDNMQEMKEAKIIPVLKGDKGEDGKRGSSFLGCVDYLSDLPNIALVQDRDYVYVKETGEIYYSNSLTWELMDRIRGIDGYTPVAGVDYEIPNEEAIASMVFDRLLYEIPEPVHGKDGVDGRDGSPDSPEDIANKLNTLEGALEISVLKGYEDSDAIIAKIKKQKLKPRDIEGMPLDFNDQRWHGGGISNITGFIQAGVNVTITGTGTSSDPYIISSTGGGSSSPQTPTGTVDGSNTVFTALATPTSVVADGSTYFNGAGYTLVGLTITMDNAPTQYIRYFA